MIWKLSLLSLDVNPTNFVAIASYYEELTGSKLKSIKNWQIFWMNNNTWRIRGQLINNCHSLLKLEKEDWEKNSKNQGGGGGKKIKKREVKNENSFPGG